MNAFSLNDGMLIGCAAAATQIEGGELNHTWNDWYHRGKIADGSNPARANEHYRLYKEDAALLQSLGMQVYRMGIEWARIEPENGKFDEQAISHYVEELELLRSYGILPLVTLHHFTNPMWFERMGAFEKSGNIQYFLRFIERMVRAFGGLVSEYITINEPNVYATNGYFFGSWPPGEKSFVKALNVMSVMAHAHIEAYKLIHTVRAQLGFDDTRVSFANHIRIFAPENKNNPMHRAFAALTERFFQGSITRAFMTGEFQPPMKGSDTIRKGKYCDFHALNYYTRSSVKNLGDGVKKGAPVNDLGWEIYPEGIAESAMKLYEICPLPIYITENGTCDNSDSFRSRYIYEHLKALCSSSLPVMRYYHWCFCDNFEWVEGESARFGIVHIDFETQERTVKESGRFLSGVIAAKGVTAELYDEFVKGQEYRINSQG